MFFQASLSGLWRPILFLICFPLQLGLSKSPPQQRLPLCGPKREGVHSAQLVGLDCAISPIFGDREGPVFLQLPVPLL